VKAGTTLAPESYTKSARIQSRAVTDIIDPGRVYAHFSEGATIVLQALHRYWKPLALFCRQLELALTHPVQTNVYLTPPSSRGLDVHYDTHDVFVLQVSGVKHWQVSDSAVELPLAHQRRTKTYSDPGAPRIDVELKPGDSLYIPRGVLHAAETASAESAHMTIGILSYTWMDVVKAAIDRGGAELFLRQALPAGFAHSPADTHEDARAILGRFVRWIEGLDAADLVAEVAEGFWSSRAPVLSGQLLELLELEAVTDETAVRRRPGATCRTRLEGRELMIVLGDRTVAVPSFVAPALDLILERGELPVRDLEPYLDANGRLVLVRRLIAEGLLERATRGRSA